MARRRRPERARLYRSASYREIAARLATNVRKLRLARGWTQEHAAEQCDLAPRMLQAIEAGDVNATLITLSRLSTGLEVPIERLLSRRAG
jgi:transcriptional regulator with XRE-family HTH domain